MACAWKFPFSDESRRDSGAAKMWGAVFEAVGTARVIDLQGVRLSLTGMGKRNRI